LAIWEEYKSKSSIGEGQYKYFIEDTKEMYGKWWRFDPNPILPGNPADRWTNDPNEAWDFKTKKLAEEHRKQFHDYDGIIVTEHEFVSPPSIGEETEGRDELWKAVCQHILNSFLLNIPDETYMPELKNDYTLIKK